MTNLNLNSWKINPWQFVKDEISLLKTIDSSLFERMSDSVKSFNSPVEFSLAAYKNVNLHNILSGKIDTSVKLICQRCLEPFDLKLSIDYQWLLVDSEEKILNNQEYYDALVVLDNEIDLIEIIEDELLLNLPIIAKHENDESCQGHNKMRQYTELKPVNPFAKLNDFLKIKH